MRRQPEADVGGCLLAMACQAHHGLAVCSSVLTACMQGGKSPVLDGALANALAALEVDAEGAHFQWCGVYKMALVGSARLLRHLAATLGEQAQPLLRTSAGEQALTSLLQVKTSSALKLPGL